MGIETEKFVSTVGDVFLCMICTLVLDNPVRLSTCEHMFCRTCINEWMHQSATCPVDMNPIVKSQLIAPNRTVVNLLNRFRIKCDFQLLGCEKVVQLKGYKSHLNQCDFNPDNKQPCVGCRMMLLKKEKYSHRCLEMFEIENKKLKQENKKLKYLVSDCQSTCKRLELDVQKLKQENDEQKTVIKELVERNASKSLMNQFLEDKITTSSIDKWLMLSRLPAQLKSRVRLAAVFGTGFDFAAVCITNNYEVFLVRANQDTVSYKNESKPMKVDSLSGFKIKEFVFSHLSQSCILALTDSGQVLECGYGENSSGTRKYVENLTNKNVVQLSCGSYHAMALTSSGEVFSWGRNFCGQLGTEAIILEPKKVTKDIGSRRTVAIACCGYSSFAVMDNGEVYSWGSNCEGQLGIDSKSKQKTPTKIIELERIKIRRLTCGYEHVLAVADDGSMYAWGRNDLGQLGTGDKRNRLRPVKIGPPEVKFIEVAASNSYNLSAALSEDGRCWVWGRCETMNWSDNEHVLLPKPVESASIHDAIAENAKYQMTWKTMMIRQQS